MNYFSGYSILVTLEIVRELGSKLLARSFVACTVGPTVDRAEDVGVDTEYGFRHLQAESPHCVSLGHVKRIIMDRIDDGTGLRKIHALANAEAATDPARVDKPHLRIMFLALLSEHLRVLVGMQGQEGLTKAG